MWHVYLGRHYAVSEDLPTDCLWEGLFPTAIEGRDLKTSVSECRLTRRQRLAVRCSIRGSCHAPFRHNKVESHCGQSRFVAMLGKHLKTVGVSLPSGDDYGEYVFSSLCVRHC